MFLSLLSFNSILTRDSAIVYDNEITRTGIKNNEAGISLYSYPYLN
jgi:hypothetical protein